MNLLFIFTERMNPNQGGVERVTVLLSRELKKSGHNIFFLAVGDNKESDTIESGFPQFFRPTSSPDFIQQFAELLRENNIEAIILQGTHNNVLHALEAVPSGIKKYLVLHNRPHPLNGYERKAMTDTPWTNLSVKHKLLKALGMFYPRLFRIVNNRKNNNRLRRILSLSDRLVLLSERFIPVLTSVTPSIDLGKISAINNPNTFSPPEEIDYRNKDNIILFVSRMSLPQKNVKDFIDVWAHFQSLHPDWKAMIVGGGEHGSIIEKYALRKKVKNLCFEGSKKNVEVYYKRAKILCLTSIYEGWGMVLTEAMAYGCVPVVFDTYESLHDILQNGHNGSLIKPFDKKAMVSSLDYLANNEQDRIRMAEAGRSSIRNFIPEKICRQWENLLIGKVTTIG